VNVPLFAGASTNPKPFQGLKPKFYPAQSPITQGFNQPKTLSGIETEIERLIVAMGSGFNQPKTLSGIETRNLLRQRSSSIASTNPKPFQGLKHLKYLD